MKQRLSTGFLIPSEMVQPRDGAGFLTFLTKTVPDLSPQMIGNYEPIRSEFQSVSQALEFWRPPFLWKRKSPPVTGAVWFGSTDAASGVYVLTSSLRLTRQCKALLLAASVAFNIDFGYIHLITDAEISSPHVSYEMWYPIDIGITSFHLKRGIPNACWAMVFGPSFIRTIGKEVLLRSPAYAVELLDEGHIFVQLTESPVDLLDFTRFELARKKFKKHVGEELFLSA